MATTPVTPTAVAQTWLQRHERLLIVAMVLLAGAWGFSRYADLSASKAEARATVAEQALTAQKATDAQNASETASVLAQYQAIVQSLQAQNASLAGIAAQRQTAVAAQQQVDSTLPVAELANRLKTLGNAPDGSVAAEGDSVKLTQLGSVAVVQTLETLPVLRADLKDQTFLTSATQDALNKANVVIVDQKKQVDGLNLTLVDADKQCKAQIADVKAQARKSKIKWFKIGFVSGFVTGLWAGHSAGL